MYRRLSFRLLCLALITFFTLPAFAQYTRDNAASKKIDEAINEHYLATDFDKAEAVLTGTINACGEKCSPAVIARAWMYVGIVRGSGKNDQAGAKEAFQKALSTDPTVKLDTQLATPETQKTAARRSRRCWRALRRQLPAPTPGNNPLSRQPMRTAAVTKVASSARPTCASSRRSARCRWSAPATKKSPAWSSVTSRSATTPGSP